MRRTWIAALALLACLALPGIAGAAIIGFSPSGQGAFVGDTINIDIVVSNLGGEIVSAWDFDVVYDPSILAATSVDFGPLLGNPALFEVFETADLSTAGSISLAQLSLLGDAALLGLQGGDSFVLATLAFDASAIGTSTLDFAGALDVVGAGGKPLDPLFGRGAVRISAAVPEPTSAVVFALGALLVGSTVKRRRA